MDNSNAASRLVASVFAASKANVSPGVFLGMANILDALSGAGSTAAPATAPVVSSVTRSKIGRPKGSGAKKASSETTEVATAENVLARLQRGKASATSALFRQLNDGEKADRIAAALKAAGEGADREVVANAVLATFGTVSSDPAAFASRHSLPASKAEGVDIKSGRKGKKGKGTEGSGG